MATHGPAREDLWRYMGDGPFSSFADYQAAFEKKQKSDDPLFWAIVDNATGFPVGQASYLRIDPAHRGIEVGNIIFAPALQRSPGATEAMYLMARHAFDDLGYRRYEWKCNALNQPSRRAALRLGFTFEGVFRQHMIVKGRNRDTAWFSMLDSEWPLRQANFRALAGAVEFRRDGPATAFALPPEWSVTFHPAEVLALFRSPWFRVLVCCCLAPSLAAQTAPAVAVLDGYTPQSSAAEIALGSEVPRPSFDRKPAQRYGAPHGSARIT